MSRSAKILKKPRSPLALPLDLSELDDDKYERNTLMITRCLNRLEEAENGKRCIVMPYQCIESEKKEDERRDYMDFKNYENVWGFEDEDLQSLDEFCPRLVEVGIMLIQRVLMIMLFYMSVAFQVFVGVGEELVQRKVGVVATRFERKMMLPLMPTMVLAVALTFAHT